MSRGETFFFCMCGILILIIGLIAESYSKKQRLYSYVQYCVDYSPIKHIIDAQLEINMPDKYCITKEDIPLVEKVIRLYTDNLIMHYFHGDLSVKYFKIRSSVHNEYVFYNDLYLFLKEYGRYQKVNDENLYIGYYEQYTDIGVVWAKIQIILGAYCKASNIINPHGYNSEYDTVDIKRRLQKSVMD